MPAGGLAAFTDRGLGHLRVAQAVARAHKQGSGKGPILQHVAMGKSHILGAQVGPK